MPLEHLEVVLCNLSATWSMGPFPLLLAQTPFYATRMQHIPATYLTFGTGICDIFPLQGKVPLLLHCPRSFGTHVLQYSMDPVRHIRGKSLF